VEAFIKRLVPNVTMLPYMTDDQVKALAATVVRLHKNESGVL
jgi:hypothetical protein